MSNLTEVLGEYKSTANSNVNLSTRIILEQPAMVETESSLFLDISQDKQFVVEKQSSNNFRIYGKITPVINYSAYDKNLITNKLIPINIDRTILDFNNNNWSVVLLNTTKRDNKKGVKELHNGKNNITYNIGSGLPAMRRVPSLNDNRKGFILYLGHTFSINDKVYIHSATENDTYIRSGVYTITSVRGNMVTINENYSYSDVVRGDTVYTTMNTAANLSEGTGFSNTKVTSPTYVKTKSFSLNLNTPKVDSLKQVPVSIRNVDFGSFDKVQVDNLVQSRPSAHKVFSPQYYIRKIVENEILEYYVKEGEVIAVLDELDDCAFSQTPYGLRNKNFVFNQYLDGTYLRDHLGYPINEVYLAIIKNSSVANGSFTNVEDSFSKLIEFTNDGDGFNVISQSTNSGTTKKPKLGDKFIISLCEYSTENLRETEIAGISHRFIHKDVLFHYNPFTKLKLRHLSSYIENGNNVKDMPNYATYSKIKETYIWRDIFDVGISDENGDVVDFPFQNNAFYVYNNINFFVNIEKNRTLKYKLNFNDINNIDLLNQGILYNIITELNSITDIVGDPTNENGDNGNNNLYAKYKDSRC